LKLVDALDFAAKKYLTQRRKDPQKTPYINHLIGVAKDTNKEFQSAFEHMFIIDIDDL